MKTFSFTVEDTFYPEPLKGTVQATNEQTAIETVKEKYFWIFGTHKSSQVVTVSEVETQNRKEIVVFDKPQTV